MKLKAAVRQGVAALRRVTGGSMKVNLNEIVTIDFETYYDSKYSLRAKVYNTSSYIRDPQFLIH